MSVSSPAAAHRTAVEVYGSFLHECVIPKVGADRVGSRKKPGRSQIDGRPVRLVTISGKGGWSSDAALAESWAGNANISLLDHLLSVARGALMFWAADAPRPWSGKTELAEIERFAHALVCIAFLHDIDKDLELPRGARIEVEAVRERMERYGINEFLARRGIHISPAAMLNYIETVEGTQASGSPAAPDYNRKIAATCGYVELADKLDGKFAGRKRDGGVTGVLTSLRDPNRWPVLQDPALRRWEAVEIHDHLHVFLLDRFQRALSTACQDIAGRLPLIETVHDGRLLSVIPHDHAPAIKKQALENFLDVLPYRLGFSINNRLACEFVGGAASWPACRETMKPRVWTTGEKDFGKLLSLPKTIARIHYREIDDLFEAAGMTTSWSPFDGPGATVKPALEHPGGDGRGLDMEPAHALVFLAVVLNHTDVKRKGAAPGAEAREQELLCLLRDEGQLPPAAAEIEPPQALALLVLAPEQTDGKAMGAAPDEETRKLQLESLAAALSKDGRARRVLLALWTVATVWSLAEDDPDSAQELLDRTLGHEGLVGLWLEGNAHRTGLADQIEDVSSGILDALRRRFEMYMTGRPVKPFDTEAPRKHCILCNEPVPVSQAVRTASRAHGIKMSAFSGRDGRNDHLASPSGDTHLCHFCLAELQLRQKAQDEFKGGGDLPPLISSPATTGLFGGLAFSAEDGDVSMGLNDLNRLDVKKGRVYEGLDCQEHRIRLARLERLPNRDAELVTQLRMVLTAVRRLGRPIHIFRGAPRPHPAIFYFDAMPAWLERLLGGESLRIEQLPDALSGLALFEQMAGAPGLGIEWAKQLADPDPRVRLGALCVAWGAAVDGRNRGDNKNANTWAVIQPEAAKRAISTIRTMEGTAMTLKDATDPLLRLAWLASRIQKRRSTRDSANKQILCWKIALDFYPDAERSTTQDTDALILGLAGTLEGELTRKNDAAAKKHREGQSLDQACIEFARHFVHEVWKKVFHSREPSSQEQRRAAQIYRFGLLETYRERGISETDDDITGEQKPKA